MKAGVKKQIENHFNLTENTEDCVVANIRTISSDADFAFLPSRLSHPAP